MRQQLELVGMLEGIPGRGVHCRPEWRGTIHQFSKMWEVFTGDHNQLARLRIPGELVGGRERSGHAGREAGSHALVQSGGAKAIGMAC